MLYQTIFLSTPSARRATDALHFGVGNALISIHALREEGDTVPMNYQSGFQRFLSTPSARRATLTGEEANRIYDISIHALREEGDAGSWADESDTTIFLSTPSARRATGTSQNAPTLLSYFYPRPPRGGRLCCHVPAHCGHRISIHALREEGDFAGG